MAHSVLTRPKAVPGAEGDVQQNRLWLGLIVFSRSDLISGLRVRFRPLRTLKGIGLFLELRRQHLKPIPNGGAGVAAKTGDGINCIGIDPEPFIDRTFAIMSIDNLAHDDLP
ncbi:hypothetical protein M2310_006856 [Rhizobium leguminosarum]|nr:hypothetical protein [Rhizobium leguminosarum]